MCQTGDRQTTAEVAHLVERQLPKLQVAGSSPVFRSLSFLASQCCILLI